MRSDQRRELRVIKLDDNDYTMLMFALGAASAGFMIRGDEKFGRIIYDLTIKIGNQEGQI